MLLSIISLGLPVCIGALAWFAVGRFQKFLDRQSAAIMAAENELRAVRQKLDALEAQINSRDLQ